MEYCVREDLNKVARASHGGTKSAESRHHQLGGRQSRDARGGEQSRECRGWNTSGAVLEGALHRAATTHGESSEEIFPAQPGQRGASALLVSHQVRGGDKGCRRQYNRTAMHLRPAVGRGFVERRTPRKRCHPLGVGGTRIRGGNQTVQPAVQDRRPERHVGGSDLVGGQPQS